jgi:hypothetical protein
MMRIILVIILILSSCTKIEIPKIKIIVKKQEDTLTLSEEAGIRQIKILDSLHNIGKF